MIPYLLTATLFLAVAGVAAADSSLVGFGLIESFSGTRWVRIHLITLGALTEMIFGVVPAMVHGRSARVRAHWREWFLLTGGLIVLAIGIPALNQPLTLTGGILVIAATISLVTRLGEGGDGPRTPFYATGLAFLVVGAVIGIGMRLGWSEGLGVEVPIEVHIHANSWGFLSLVFAGLVFDRFDIWTGAQLVVAKSRQAIFWLMSLGALGLVIGPWIGSRVVLVPGLLAHLTATVWLVVGIVRSFSGSAGSWSRPGTWHLVSSYFWLLAPVLVAPLILFEVSGFPGAGIEANAPQALIYGWVLQFGIAVAPALFARNGGRLGGNWLSLVAIHAGAVFLWAGIFLEPQGILHGIAYALWTAAILPVAIEVAGVARTALEAQPT